MVDARGNVREARDYYPFGLQMPGRVYVQGSETREGFTGHERAADTLATETEDLLANALVDAGGLDKTVAFAVAAEALQAARDTLLLAVPAAVAAADEGRPR